MFNFQPKQHSLHSWIIIMCSLGRLVGIWRIVLTVALHLQHAESHCNQTLSSWRMNLDLPLHQHPPGNRLLSSRSQLWSPSKTYTYIASPVEKNRLGAMGLQWSKTILVHLFCLVIWFRLCWSIRIFGRQERSWGTPAFRKHVKY